MGVMNEEELAAVARRMTRGRKGILAIDESIATCDSRFCALGIAPGVAMRRAWRELLVTAPGLHEHIAAVILSDETIGQAGADGLPFAAGLASRGIIAGIKVDRGLTPFAGDGELVTEGLDGLAARLAAYRLQGAQFADELGQQGNRLL